MPVQAVSKATVKGASVQDPCREHTHLISSPCEFSPGYCNGVEGPTKGGPYCAACCTNTDSQL